MKVAPEGVAMIVRPNWKDIDAYRACETLSLHGGIAWEFIKRNPEYQNDIALFQAEVVAFVSENLSDFLEECDDEEIHTKICFFGEHNPERWTHCCQYFGKKWNLISPVSSDEEWTGDQAIFTTLDDSVSFDRVVLHQVKGPRVLIPVDLSEPLDIVLKKAEHHIRRLRKDGIERGTVNPDTRRILSTAVYVEYLRILDGVEAGATLQKIGEVVSPTAENDPTDKQRDKRIRAAYSAALKMQNGGYRVLMY